MKKIHAVAAGLIAGVTLAVAAVAATDGDVRTSALLEGRGPHLTMPERGARALSNLEEPVTAELVWKPCHASLSSLYPIWELRGGSRTRYVDQAGHVYDELVPAGPG